MIIFLVILVIIMKQLTHTVGQETSQQAKSSHSEPRAHTVGQELTQWSKSSHSGPRVNTQGKNPNIRPLGHRSGFFKISLLIKLCTMGQEFTHQTKSSHTGPRVNTLGQELTHRAKTQTFGHWVLGVDFLNQSFNQTLHNGPRVHTVGHELTQQATTCESHLLATADIVIVIIWTK